MEQRIFRTLETKEYFELWKQKNISNLGNKRIFRILETKEYFDLDPIMYYMNTCTALTDTHTGLVCKGLPATFTCTCRYRYAF
jgi:hypothetical protein